MKENIFVQDVARAVGFENTMLHSVVKQHMEQDVVVDKVEEDVRTFVS